MFKDGVIEKRGRNASNRADILSGLLKTTDKRLL
jgi:hypothetical protein